MKRDCSSLLGLVAALGLAWAAPGQAAEDAGSPRMNYLLHCSGCHGQDGSGSPDHGIPTMRGTLGHFLKVKDGREFLIQVPGTSHSNLGDREVAELANWLLKTFSPAEVPAGTQPYTQQEVTDLRHHPLTDVPSRRAQIVLRLKDQGIVIE